MKKIISSVIRQPVTVLMLTLLLIFGGVVGTLGMPLQLIPDMQIPIVSVVVTYPGASAATVEETVTGKVSDALGGVGGVEQVYTYSYDNVSAVMLEFGFGVDLDEKMSDVRDHVASLDLPDGCASPEVTNVDLNGEATAILYVTAGSGSAEDVARAADEADKFAASLAAIDGVGSVELDGEPSHGVTVKPFGGLESGVLLLVEALGGGAYDLPLGSIETSDGSVQIRNLSDVADTDDIRALPVTLPKELTSILAEGESVFQKYESLDYQTLNMMITAIKSGLVDPSEYTDSALALAFINSEHFADNADVLLAFKSGHPSALTTEESYELYSSLYLSDVTDLEMSYEVIKLMREGEFVSGSEKTVRLGDIASVVGPGDEGYMPSYDAYAYLDGVQGVKVSVFAAQGANGAEIVRRIKEIVGETEFSEGVRVVLTDDQSEFISDSVGNVLVSMIIGGVLAVLVIFVFLRKVKPSLIISVTMPLSVLSALLLLSLLGVTLNMVSLGGLAVGIGMLVDNSIVVIEAISKRRDMGDRPYRAAVLGTSEVAGALVGSTLTTVCAFIPIMFVGGLCAEIFTDMAWAVIWSLTFSLLVAVTVIPTMYVLFSPDGRLLRGGNLAKSELKKEDAEMCAPNRLVVAGADKENVAAETLTEDANAAIAETKPETAETENNPTKKKHRGSVMDGAERVYGKIIERVLRFKALVIIVAIAVFAGSMALAFTSGTEFLPSVDKGQINIGLTYNGGTKLEEAETDAFALADRIENGVDGIGSISVSVGVQGLLAFNNTGSIDIKLDGDAGKTSKVTQQIREIVMTARSDGSLPYTAAATVTEIDGVVESLTGGMSDISVTVRGEKRDALAEIGAAVSEKLSSDEYAERGFVNITSSLGEDNTAVEYDISFDRFALAEKGIDYAQAVMTLRVGLAGYTAGAATVDGVNCDVTVIFEEGAVSEIADLESFVLGYSDGAAVKLSDVAEITQTVADSVIKKEDGKFSVTITAEVYDLDSGTAIELMREAAESVLALPDGDSGKTYAENGYECVTSGVATYLDDAFGGLYIALAVSLLLLYGVMAAQFGSAIKPLIIMCAIPFSFTGGFLALAITGSTLNVVSLVGLIMLMGVIVNNAIVMLEKIKQLLEEEGLSHYEAVVKGCSSRLRPILMTTLTTVLALIPLALGLGSGGELMQPLGIVVMGGLLVGTLVTLVLIPCIYCGINRLVADANGER